MTIARYLLPFLLSSASLVVAVSATNAFAQDGAESGELEAPDLGSLGTGWWSYFEGPTNEVEPRVEQFLSEIDARVSRLQAGNEPVGRAALDAIRDNFSAYVALLDEDTLEFLELPPAKVAYTLDELLHLAAIARSASDGAAQEGAEVEREQRIFDGASRRRDLAFKNYVVDSTIGDEHLLVALRLIQTRSAQEIAARRLQLLTQSFDRAEAYAESTAARAAVASETLSTTVNEESLASIREQLQNDTEAVRQAEEGLRAAELAAAGLNLDTAAGRSQQRLAQQKMVEAEVVLSLAKARAAQTEARTSWIELHSDAVPNLDSVLENALLWSDLAASVQENVPLWRRDSEEELLAVQTIDRTGLDRSFRRLLDQRIGTAQETLARITELEAATADLELLSVAVDSAAAVYAGAFSSWVRDAGRLLKRGYGRIVGLSDATLFSVGETPVTGRDILRVIIILLVAFLLSRGVRFAIRRFGDRDSSGTQASLYTVSRLTHYAIIIVAVFVALSSIGLDFSSLALVAGALSVGIGFGLQSIVSNFVSGLIILFEHTLRVGDYIELDTGLTGTVKAINVRSTLINTNDNIDIVVPNSEFVTARLTNWTLGERILRVRIPFGVAYGSDKDRVKQAALEAAEEVPYTLTHMKGREPDAWLIEFGDSSLNFLMTVWVNRQGARRPTRTRAAYLWALETKLTEHGIEIPFPQRDLNLRGTWPVVRDEVSASITGGAPLADDQDTAV